MRWGAGMGQSIWHLLLAAILHVGPAAFKQDPRVDFDSSLILECLEVLTSPQYSISPDCLPFNTVTYFANIFNFVYYFVCNRASRATVGYWSQPYSECTGHSRIRSVPVTVVFIAYYLLCVAVVYWSL